MRADRVIVCFLAAAALAGCASRPINEPITQVDPKSGYRPYLLIPKRQNNDPNTLLLLAFSGGGTRATRLRSAGCPVVGRFVGIPQAASSGIHVSPGT